MSTSDFIFPMLWMTIGCWPFLFAVIYLEKKTGKRVYQKGFPKKRAAILACFMCGPLAGLIIIAAVVVKKVLDVFFIGECKESEDE